MQNDENPTLERWKHPGSVTAKDDRTAPREAESRSRYWHQSLALKVLENLTRPTQPQHRPHRRRQKWPRLSLQEARSASAKNDAEPLLGQLNAKKGDWRLSQGLRNPHSQQTSWCDGSWWWTACLVLERQGRQLCKTTLASKRNLPFSR